MKFHRLAYVCATVVLVAAATSCSSSDVVEKPATPRVKNAALAAPPVLINGQFDAGKGGWTYADSGQLVGRGCTSSLASLSKLPSMGYASASALVFGRANNEVVQVVTVPQPGKVTFSLTVNKIFPPVQVLDVRLTSASGMAGETVRKTGRISKSVVTTSPNESVSINLFGFNNGRAGCSGLSVSNATLTYEQAVVVTTTLATTTTSTTSTTLLPTTTTSTTPAASSIQCGGTVPCALGNIGPGSGRVYLVDSDQPTKYNRYFEVAHPNWNSAMGDPLLTVSEAQQTVARGVKNATGQIVGTSPLGSLGELDWRVPNIAELEQIYKSPNKGGIARGEYLSITRNSLTDMTWMFLNFETGVRRITSLDNWRTEKGLVRPVRRGPSPCAFGGACKVGDVGPNGGKVFYVTTKDKPITTGKDLDPCKSSWNPCIYMELAPDNWSGSDTDPSKLWAEPIRGCCKEVPNNGAKGTAIGTGAANTDAIRNQQQQFDSAAATASKGIGKDGNWSLPSLEELFEIYLQRTKVNAPKSGEYWTSTEAGPHSAKVIDFSATSSSIGEASNTIYKDTSWRPVRPVRAFAPACPCS